MAEGELKDVNPFTDGNSKGHCSQRTSLSLVGLHSKVQVRQQTKEGYFPQSPYPGLIWELCVRNPESACSSRLCSVH